MTPREIHAWMAKNSYSVRRLAATLGVTPATIQRWRSGTTIPPAYLWRALRDLERERWMVAGRLDAPATVQREHDARANLREPATTGEVRCIWCERYLPLEDFRKENGHRIGRQRRCKRCDNVYAMIKRARRKVRRGGRFEGAV